jgi:hypothetical protein
MLRIWPRRTLEAIVIIVTYAIALIVALAAPDLKQRYVAKRVSGCNQIASNSNCWPATIFEVAGF